MATKSNPYTVDARQKRGRPRQHPLSSFELRHSQDTQEGLRLTEPTINRPSPFWWKFGRREIFIDGEWHFDTNPQKFYLLGYAYDRFHFGWLYNQNDYEYKGKVMYKPPFKGQDRLNEYWLRKLFYGVETIYFYGPDIGQLERMYGLDLKNNYRCINLLTVVKKIVPEKDIMRATIEYNRKHPGVLKDATKPSYRLCVLEYLLGCERTTEEYKADIDNLHRDWYNPRLRAKALLYNKEDVINLIEVKDRLYGRYYVRQSVEDACALKPTKK